MKYKLFKIKVFLTIGFLVGFIVNGIFITIYNVDRSANMALVSSETQEYKFKNSLLNEEILTEDSLTQFSENAEDLGFGLASNVIYLDKAETVAQVR